MPRSALDLLDALPDATPDFGMPAQPAAPRSALDLLDSLPDVTPAAPDTLGVSTRTPSLGLEPGAPVSVVAESTRAPGAMPEAPAVVPQTGFEAGLRRGFEGIGQGAQITGQLVQGEVPQVDAPKNDEYTKLMNAPLSEKLLNPEWWATFGGEMAAGSTPFLAGATVGGVVGGPLGAALGGGLAVVWQTLGSEYQTQRQEGKSHEAATETALLTALASGGINTAAVPLALRRELSGTVGRVLAGVAAQSALGGMDTEVQNQIAGRPSGSGVAEAMIGEAVAEGPATIGVAKAAAMDRIRRPAGNAGRITDQTGRPDPTQQRAVPVEGTPAEVPVYAVPPEDLDALRELGKRSTLSPERVEELIQIAGKSREGYDRARLAISSKLKPEVAQEPPPATEAQPAASAAPTQSAPVSTPEVQEPWQLRKGGMVSFEDATRLERTSPSVEPASYREKDLWEASVKNRQLETTPPVFTEYPVGTWAIDSQGELWQLRRMPLDDLLLLEEYKKNQTTQKYIDWIKEGKIPPPMTGFERENGEVKVSDGHHRAEALRQAGINDALIWVNPVANKTLENGENMPYALTHKRAVEIALDEGKNVPPEVLADYPDLQKSDTPVTVERAAPAAEVKTPESAEPAPAVTHASTRRAISQAVDEDAIDAALEAYTEAVNAGQASVEVLRPLMDLANDRRRELKVEALKTAESAPTSQPAPESVPIANGTPTTAAIEGAGVHELVVAPAERPDSPGQSPSVSSARAAAAPRGPRRTRVPMASLNQVMKGIGLHPSEIERIYGRAGNADDPRVKSALGKIGKSSNSLEVALQENWDTPAGEVFRAAGVKDVNDVDGLAEALNDPARLFQQYPTDMAKAAQREAEDQQQADTEDALAEYDDRLASEVPQQEAHLTPVLQALGYTSAVRTGQRPVDWYEQRQRSAMGATADQPAPEPMAAQDQPAGPPAPMEAMADEEGVDPAATGQEQARAEDEAFTRFSAAVPAEELQRLPVGDSGQTFGSVLAEYPSLRNAVAVVRDHTDLPEGVLSYAKDNGVDPAKIEAVYHHGRVFVVAQHINRPSDLRGKVAHEVGIHLGMRAAMGVQPFTEMAQNVWGTLTPAERAAIAKRNQLKDTDTSIIGEEWLGYEAERVVNAGKIDSLWKRIAARIRGELRRRFRANLRYSDAEIAQMIVKGWKAAGEYADGIAAMDAAVQNGQVRYSVAAEAGATNAGQIAQAKKEWQEKGTESRWFRRWFGGSKVVDGEGKPLVVYHGTSGKDFSVIDPNRKKNRRAPDAQLGVFATEHPEYADLYTFNDAVFLGDRQQRRLKGARLYPVYMNIKNPRTYETWFDLFREADRVGSGLALRKQLEKQGYDGIRVTHDDAAGGRDRGMMTWQPAWVVFDSSQIKSATGNRGTFDPDNADIRYSLSQSTEGPSSPRKPTTPLDDARAIYAALKQDDPTQATRALWTAYANTLAAHGYDMDALPSAAYVDRYWLGEPVPADLQDEMREFRTWAEPVIAAVRQTTEIPKSTDDALKVMLGKRKPPSSIERAIDQAFAGKAPEDDTRERRFPQSLGNAGFVQGDNLTYRRITNDESEQQARKRVADSLEDAQQWVVDPQNEGTAEHTATGIAVIAARQAQWMELRRQAAAARESDPEQAKALEDQARNRLKAASEVAAALSERLTRAGQEVQAASMLTRLLPETVLYRAEEAVKALNATRPPSKQTVLSERAAARLTGMAEQAGDWGTVTAQVKALADAARVLSRGGAAPTVEEVGKLRDAAAAIRKTMAGFLPETEQQAKEKKPAKPKPLYVTLAENWLDEKAGSAAQRLKDRGIVFSAGLDVAAMRDISIVGAAKMAKGAVRLTAWTQAMVGEFGQGFTKDEEQYQKLYDMSKAEYGRMKKKAAQAQRLLEKIDTEIVRLEADPRLRETPDMRVLGDAVDALKTLTGDEQLMLAKEINGAIQALGQPVTAWDKTTTALHISRLLNPKTFTRNAIGNELFWRMERLSKFTAATMDLAYSKATKKDRQVVFTFRNPVEGAVSYWTDFMRGARAAARGVSLTESKWDLPTRQAFTRGPMATLERALGVSLKAMDYAAMERARRSVLDELAESAARKAGITEDRAGWKAQWVEKADENILKMANAYGQYATFQDQNILSDALVGAQSLLRGNINGKRRNIPLIADYFLPYAKTPANLLMRALEYSPVGIARSLYFLTEAATVAHPMTRREGLLALSRALAGTGISAVAWHLVGLGILSGTKEKDRDLREFMTEQTGERNYQVNLSALQRYVLAGFEDEAARKREGDWLVSYDWAQPMAVSAALGANARQADQGEMGAGDWVDMGVMAMSGGFQTLSEQSMLQGLTAFGEVLAGRPDRARYIVEGIPAGFIPAVLNQARQLQDNTVRETQAPTLLERTYNRALARLPWASQTLPAVYKSMGVDVPRETYQGGSNGLFNVLVNPAFVAEYHTDPLIESLLGPYQQEGEKRQFPRKVNSSIQISAEDMAKATRQRGVKEREFELTGADKQELQRVVAGYTQRGMAKLNLGQLRRRTPADQTKAFVEVLNDAAKQGRQWFIKRRLPAYLAKE